MQSAAHRSPILGWITAIFLLTMVGNCDESLSTKWAEADLVGTWESTTISGRVTLVFSQADGINAYLFSATDGELTGINLHDGSDILSQGRWSLVNNVLTLADDGAYPLSCPVLDYFDILMSNAKDAFTLDYRPDVENSCLTRSQFLEEAGWHLQGPVG